MRGVGERLRLVLAVSVFLLSCNTFDAPGDGGGPFGTAQPPPPGAPGPGFFGSAGRGVVLTGPAGSSGSPFFGGSGAIGAGSAGIFEAGSGGSGGWQLLDAGTPPSPDDAGTDDAGL